MALRSFQASLKKRLGLPHRRLKGGIGAVGARQQLRRGLADVTDAERVDEAVERNAAPFVDRRIELADADLAETVNILQLGQRLLLALLQREDIGRGADLQRRVVVFEEEVDLLRTEPFNIESVARNEVLQMLRRLRPADEATGAAAHRIHLAGLLVDLAHGMRTADRACLREFV